MASIRKQSMTDRMPVYVISLKDSEIRRRNMMARLEMAGIPFQFIDAIDGRTGRLPDQFDGARVVREGFWGESALACAMSHRKVHRIVSEGPEKLALILEDDVKLADDFCETLASATTFEFDVFKFEGGPYWPLAVPSRVSVGTIGRYCVVVGMTPSMASAAYLLTTSAARRFCSLPVLDQMPDEAFGDLRLALKVLELHPYAVVQDRETPTMVNLQSYGNRPQQFRRNLVARLLHSMRKRAHIIRAHGPRIAIAIEMQRLAGNKR
jgi:GR25 family glycosyltransferase involved in LPS biosynthesis